MSKGLVHLYTGDGKGKTTAALGLSLRALGAGDEVYFFQFMKKGDSSEFRILESLEGVHCAHFGTGRFIRKGKPDEDSRLEIESNRKGFETVLRIFDSFNNETSKDPHHPQGKRLVVLDELCLLLFFDIVSLEEALELVRAKPESVELVITGRRAPDELVELCDYVSEIKERKHPYQKGVQAREGIES